MKGKCDRPQTERIVFIGLYVLNTSKISRVLAPHESIIRRVRQLLEEQNRVDSVKFLF